LNTHDSPFDGWDAFQRWLEQPGDKLEFGYRREQVRVERARLRKDAGRLAEAFNTDDARIRSQAVEALGILRTNEAVDALIDILASSRARGFERWQIIRTLADLGDARAVRALTGQLDSGHRQDVFWALGSIGGPEATDVLIGEIGEGRYVPAVFALARTGISPSDLIRRCGEQDIKVLRPASLLPLAGEAVREYYDEARAADLAASLLETAWDETCDIAAREFLEGRIRAFLPIPDPDTDWEENSADRDRRNQRHRAEALALVQRLPVRCRRALIWIADDRSRSAEQWPASAIDPDYWPTWSAAAAMRVAALNLIDEAAVASPAGRPRFRALREEIEHASPDE
jgi:hypothetical protein